MRRIIMWTLGAALLALGLPAPGVAQTAVRPLAEVRISQAQVAADLLQRRARLEVAGVERAHAVRLLAERSGIPIAFSPSLLPGDRQVDCWCDAATVGDALAIILRGTGLQATAVRGRIVLERQATAHDGARQIGSMPVSLTSAEPTYTGGVTVPPFAEQRRVVMPVIVQEATVSGVVTESGTGRGLAGAVVQVEGTARFATANENGRYLLAGLPAGRHTLVATMLGYATQRQTLELAIGSSLVADFALSAAPLRLDEFVVTAAGERRRSEVANVVSTIHAEAIVRTAPVTDMMSLINARAPGVQVLAASGTVGGYTRIRIRGRNSMSLSNDPIVYLDGVRVNATNTGATDYPSRFDDLNPDEIETLDILKGPAAVALYGTDAANGVIVIRTKRGMAGPARWNVFASTGITEQPTAFPDAYYGHGRRVSDDAATQCILTAIAAGTCVQDELRTLNLMTDPARTPFSTGFRHQTGVQVSGGTEVTRYFVGVDYADEKGTLRMPQNERERIEAERGAPVTRQQQFPNTLRMVNLRGNFNTVLRSNADVNISLGYIDRTQHIVPTGGSFIFGVMRNALQGRGFEDALGGWWTYPAGDLFSVEETEGVNRVTAGVGPSWRPFAWLDTRAMVGLDMTNRASMQLQRRDEGMNFSDFRLGRRSETRNTTAMYTVDGAANATFQLNENVGTRTSAGMQYFRTIVRQITASGNNLAPGSVVIGGAATRDGGQSNSETATLGAFVEQMVGLRERLFLTASVRTDQNSAFGRDFDAVLYPRGSVSWLVSEEPFFPAIDWLKTTRLRLAYGTSGVAPGTLHALQFYSPVSAVLGNVARPGLQYQALGNVDLKPERTTELETGVDIDLIDGRATFELTHYRKKSVDALINRPLPVSLGLTSSTRFENLGSVENVGWEGTLNLRLVERRAVGLEVTLSGSVNRNELLELGEGVSPVINSFSGNRATPGYPLFGRWARPILSYADANDNGIIEPGEIQVGPEAVYLGPSMPTREASLAPTLTLLNGSLRLSGLLDHRGGFLAYNRTEADRCTGASNCRAVNDRSASLWEQARAVAARTSSLGSTHAGYMEDGTYTKLRELSLSYTVPRQYSRFIGASGTTLSLAGRNLHTWTGYSGVDPELIWTDNDALEFNLVPPSRHWVIRINATY